MPKATSRITYRPLSEKDQQAKNNTKTYEPGDDVPADVAKDVPGAVEAGDLKLKDGDVTSEAAVKRSIAHAPDHPERPTHIPGVDDWKVAKSGAFAGEPVVTAEDKAEARAELRSDVDADETKKLGGKK